MITENMTTKVLHIISLALTPIERWGAAKHPFGASSAAEGWLTVLAMVALITSVILVFWLSAKHRRSLERLRREIAGLGLKVTFEELRQEIEELRQEIAELRQHTPAEASEQMPSEESEELVVIEAES